MAISVTMEGDATGLIDSIQLASDEVRTLGVDVENAEAQWTSAFAGMDDAAERTTQSMDRMSTGGSKATQILFSAGDAAQDAQFGFAGAANNITFMAEQFSELVTETGSARTAMQAVVGSLTGVGGIMLAIQALMIVAPRLIEWFNSSEEAAKEASEAFSKFADDIITVEGQFSDVEFEPVSPKRAREILTFMDQFLQNENRRIKRLEKAVQLRKDASGARGLIARQQLEQMGLQDRSLFQLQQSLQAVKDRVAATQALERRLRKQEDLTEEDVRMKRLAHLFGLDIKETEEETTKKIEEGNKRLDRRLQAMREMGVVANQVGNNLRNIRLEGLSGDLAFVGRVLDKGVNQSLKQVRTAIALMKQELAEAGGETERNFIRGLISQLTELESKMADVQDEAILTKDQLKGIAGSAMQQAFMDLGTAIGEGEPIIESFGQAAKDILSQVASQIAQILIASGTGRLLSGDPTGAALIAAGVALQASAAALSASGGGGRGARARGSQRSLRGGGEAGINVPGRRSGGPVGAGGMYQTHGLGQREFFVPSMDGSIMTQGQMANQRQRVDVGVTMDDVSVDMDFLRLNARLRETNRTLNRIARQ